MAIVVVVAVLCGVPADAQSLGQDLSRGIAVVQEETLDAVAAGAQSGQQVAAGEQDKKPTRGFFGSLGRNLVDDVKHMPRRNSLYWLAAGAAGALAIHPEDDEINQHFVGSDLADKFFTPGKVLGATEFVLPAALTTYLIGRKTQSERVQHLGMDIIEATLLSEAITQAIKFSVRRHRPIFPDGSSTPGYAFPSGHATTTFAAATVLQQHLGWRAAVPTYLVASFVAISRLHDNRHFASDVVFGATDGIIIGRSVTWHGRNFYATPTFVPHGAGLVVNLAP